MALQICFITAEMTPFAKAGGLADVSGALVKYLHAAGHDIRLFMPGYTSIARARLEIYPVDFLQDVALRIGTLDFPLVLTRENRPVSMNSGDNKPFPSRNSPRRLAWPRTSPFHGGNTGSNPVGDAKSNQ